MKRLVALLAVVAAIVGGLWLAPSDHYLLLPDPASPVDPLVDVPGDGEGGADKGGVYYLVAIVRRASLFERLFPQIREGGTLLPAHAINPFDVSERERRQESLQEMSLSQKKAIVVALRELDYRVPVRRTGVAVAVVLADTPADGTLRVGDVIVSIEGERVRTLAALRRRMRDVRPGERVRLTVERDGRRRTLRVGTEAAEDDPDRALLGIITEETLEVDLPIEVSIDAGDIGGPSAGLAFALHIVDELGQDLDDGRRIAATGELDLDGKVGGIGGIKQKAIGAREAEVDVLVVPEANAEEARRYADDVDVVAVGTFGEALSELKTG